MTNKTSTIFLRPFIFLSQWRSFPYYELVSYAFMFASVPMLAYGVKSYNLPILKTILFTILALYSGFFAALIWNDITDADIDVIVHPNRPLPTGRVKVKKFFAVALLFSALTFIFSFLVSFWCFILVGVAALFVAFHNKYLKRIVKLSAYSEIFTPLQWIIVPIFGFLAIDGTNLQTMLLLVAFTYFADGAHDLPEGIHDREGDYKFGVRTYATSYGEKLSAKISFIMFFFSGLIGISLFLRTILSFIFLVPFLMLWIYTLSWSYTLIKSSVEDMKKMGGVVGKKGFNFFLASYSFIFLDIVVQLILYHSGV